MEQQNELPWVHLPASAFVSILPTCFIYISTHSLLIHSIINITVFL